MNVSTLSIQTFCRVVPLAAYSALVSHKIHQRHLIIVLELRAGQPWRRVHESNACLPPSCRHPCIISSRAKLSLFSTDWPSGLSRTALERRSWLPALRDLANAIIPSKRDFWQSVVNPHPRLRVVSSPMIPIVVFDVLVALRELAGWRAVKHGLPLIPAFLNMALKSTRVQRLQQFERAK